MLGTIVNTACILLGTAIGATLRSRLDKRLQQSLYNALGLVTLALGANMCVSNMARSQVPVLFIASLCVGSLTGMWLDIDRRIDSLAARHNASRLAQGLTTACLLYRIGTLSIMGPVLSAVHGDNTYLFTNATLDLVSSAVFAATYGWGMALGAVVLFCWQGSIWLMARLLNDAGAIPDALMAEVSLVGGVLLLSSGLAILDIKDCKTVNMLPALLVPVVYFLMFHQG